MRPVRRGHLPRRAPVYVVAHPVRRGHLPRRAQKKQPGAEGVGGGLLAASTPGWSRRFWAASMLCAAGGRWIGASQCTVPGHRTIQGAGRRLGPPRSVERSLCTAGGRWNGASQCTIQGAGRRLGPPRSVERSLPQAGEHRESRGVAGALTRSEVFLSGYCSGPPCSSPWQHHGRPTPAPTSSRSPSPSTRPRSATRRRSTRPT